MHLLTSVSLWSLGFWYWEKKLKNGRSFFVEESWLVQCYWWLHFNVWFSTFHKPPFLLTENQTIFYGNVSCQHLIIRCDNFDTLIRILKKLPEILTLSEKASLDAYLNIMNNKLEPRVIPYQFFLHFLGITQKCIFLFVLYC